MQSFIASIHYFVNHSSWYLFCKCYIFIIFSNCFLVFPCLKTCHILRFLCFIICCTVCFVRSFLYLRLYHIFLHLKLCCPLYAPLVRAFVFASHARIVALLRNIISVSHLFCGLIKINGTSLFCKCFIKIICRLWIIVARWMHMIEVIKLVWADLNLLKFVHDALEWSKLIQSYPSSPIFIQTHSNSSELTRTCHNDPELHRTRPN